MTKEELEKEAEEYTEKHWGASLSVIRVLKQTYLAVAEPREKRIAELEKENANLRVSLESTRCAGIELLSDKRKQLAKAKEIIKKYLAIGVGGKITQNYLDVTKEAEQFLKENA